MLAAYFCDSRYSQVEYNCETIKMDWLEDGVAQRVIGALLIISLCVQFAQSFCQWEVRVDYLTKS